MDPMKFLQPQRVSKSDWFATVKDYKDWLDSNTIQVTHVNIMSNGLILVTYVEV